MTIAVPGGMIGGSPATAATSADYAPDVESLLDRRSPGNRRYGWLVDSKPGRYAADDPVERVLSSVRRRPAAVAAPGDTEPFDAPIAALTVLPDPNGAIDDVVDPGDVGGLIGEAGTGGAPIAGGVLPGVGGGSSDTPGTSTPQNPASAVPEPASWAMLLIGFALIGRRLRRPGSGLAVAQ